METHLPTIINGHQIAQVFLDTKCKDIVIFCHGFRSSSIGPNRFFVRAARELTKKGISSVRFDQYGSGNSEGDFKVSSFNDWIATTKALVGKYLQQGYRVALFGQSMGGSVVLNVGADMPEIHSIVSWVPDPELEPIKNVGSDYVEENGQIVQKSYWFEAYDAHTADRIPGIKAPTLIVQCSDDEFVSTECHKAIENNVQLHHKLKMYDGYKHSSWTYDQATSIIDESIEFLVTNFS